MEEFRKMLDDLALVNLKSDKGWFTWTNDRRADSLVQVRLDRFVTSASWLNKVHFLTTKVVRQGS